MRTSTVRARTRTARLTASTVVALGLLLAGTLPAGASCAPAPERPSSPHVFVGTVIRTRSNDRIATVRTADGQTVIVRGTMVDADNTATSVDRQYRVGGRYEFHPYNASSPFGDDACSQTRLLSVERRSRDVDGGRPPLGPRVPRAVLGGFAVAAVVLAAVLVALAARGRRLR